MRELLLADWRTKAWAFALALLLWYHASQQVLLTDILYVPLQLTNQENTYVVVKQPADQVVRVYIKGPRTMVERLRAADIRVVVPVEPPIAKSQEREVELTSHLVERLPRDVEVTGFSPGRVVLELSQMGERTLTVLLPPTDSVGTPAPGHEVARITAFPPQVKVEGPVSVLDQAEGIPIKPISITPMQTGLIERWDWPLAEQLDGQRVRPLSKVTVDILILPKRERKQLDVPVLLAQPADYAYEAQLAPGSSKTVTLEVEGPPEQVQGLSADSVQVIVSVKGLAPSETQAPVTAQVVLPQGVTLVGEPPQVKVDIRERPPAPPKAS
jgi:YbbR domain-containing protein